MANEHPFKDEYLFYRFRVDEVRLLVALLPRSRMAFMSRACRRSLCPHLVALIRPFPLPLPPGDECAQHDVCVVPAAAAGC